MRLINLITTFVANLGVIVNPTIGVLYLDYLEQFHEPDVTHRNEYFGVDEGNELATGESMHDNRIRPRFNAYEDSSVWGCKFKTCSGTHQSPIKIDTDKLVINPHLTPLEAPHYGIPVENVIAKNLGYSVELTIPKSVDILLYGSDLSGTYRLRTISFNWRNESWRGSLHTVDEKYFPLEVVFVHRNVKYTTRLKKPDLETRISTFATISGEDNEYLKPIVEVLHKIRLPDKSVTIRKPLTLRKLLPPDTNHYVRYKGSMVIPPCYEGVLWYILHQSITVSENQLKEFRKLKRNRPEDPKPRFMEYRTGREIQPLNNRIVESTPFVEERNSYPGDAKDTFY